MRLAHIGGARDRGRDLIGDWALGGRRSAVFVQCKSHLRSKVAPAAIREVLGADLDAKNTVRFICGHSGFSQEALRALREAQLPLAAISFESERCKEVKEFVSNGAFRKYLPLLQIAHKRAPGEVEIVLCYDDQVLSILN